MYSQDCVTHDTAMRLRKAGFAEPCEYWYYDGELRKYHDDERINRNTNGQGRQRKCSAPFLWQAQKWLRDKHEIDIEVLLDFENEYTEGCRRLVRTYEVMLVEPVYRTTRVANNRPTYEDALAIGISAALDTI